MAGAVSSCPYIGVLAILLMSMRLEAVDAVTAWNCSSDELKRTTVYFNDISDTEFINSSKILGDRYPDEFAYNVMGVPGYVAIMEDDKFHIVQCSPELVTLLSQNECYDRLEIMKDNQTLFLTPWTHIIADSVNEIPCNSPNLQDYELEATTYKVVPRPKVNLEPGKGNSKTRDPDKPEPIIRLKPNTKLTWEYQKLDNLGMNGLFGEKEFNNAWDRLRSPNSHREVFGQPIPDVTVKYPTLTAPSSPEISLFKKWFG